MGKVEGMCSSGTIFYSQFKRTNYLVLGETVSGSTTTTVNKHSNLRLIDKAKIVVSRTDIRCVFLIDIHIQRLQLL